MKKADKFARANESQEVFEAAVESSMRLFHALSRTDLPYALDALAPGHRERQQAVIWGVGALRKAPGKLVDRTSTEPIAHDALRLGIAQFLAIDQPLPIEAKNWLVSFLCGNRPRPKPPVSKGARKGGRPTSEFAHVMIHQAVLFLTERGMNATRNDVSPPTSACDAVAEALRRMGRSPVTFKGVKEIWRTIGKAIDEAPDAGTLYWVDEDGGLETKEFSGHEVPKRDE